MVAYYESKTPGLGASYLKEFEFAVKEIIAAPNRYPIEKKPDIRRKMMKKFPFNILYRNESKTVQILAVAHFRRRPMYWFGRI